jgi:hypothetical protein
MKVLRTADFWIPFTALAVGLLAAALLRVLLMRHARTRRSRTAAALARHTVRPLLLPVFLARDVRSNTSGRTSIAMSQRTPSHCPAIFRSSAVMASRVAGFA